MAVTWVNPAITPEMADAATESAATPPNCTWMACRGAQSGALAIRPSMMDWFSAPEPVRYSVTAEPFAAGWCGEFRRPSALTATTEPEPLGPAKTPGAAAATGTEIGSDNRVIDLTGQSLPIFGVVRV